MGKGYSKTDEKPELENIIVSQQQGGDDEKLSRVEVLTRLLHEKSRRSKEQVRDEDDTRKDKMVVLKQAFKKLDPTILKTSASTSNGEIQLQLKYMAREGVLLVKVVQARDLNSKDLRGKESSPFVQLFLYPSEVDDGVMQTETAKKTRYPEYNELFTIPVHTEQLITSRLVVQVFDKDQLMGKDDFIGETILFMSNFDFSTPEIHTGWYTLQAETDLQIQGSLEITLSFKGTQTLLVTLHKGVDLTNKYESGGTPNPFVKMSIPGVASAYRTKMKRNTADPIWEETFEFDIPKEELQHRYIVFHCIDYDKSGKNDSLGQVIIDLIRVTENKDLVFAGSFELADLKNCDRLRSRLFQHATMQEFREALIAHAAARNPEIVFNDRHRSKILKLHNIKAAASARLRVIEGIPVY